MARIFDWLIKLFTDDHGTPSAMRVAAFMVIMNIMVVWSYKNVVASEWVPIGANAAALIIGILGAKAYQKKHEKKGD